jgi:hypothetical protein
MSEKISEELIYSPTVNNHSTVIYRNISPQGSSSVTLGSSLSGPVEFVISPSCWNPSKSRLNFQINLTASGTTNPYHYINANTSCAIGRITVYDSATNSLLMDCSNFEKYAQLIIPTATDNEDFLTKAFDLAIPATTSITSTPYPVEDLGRVNSTTNLNSNGESMAVYNPYTGKREWYICGANTANFLDVSIPFSAFKFSFLSTNSVLYSPSNLVVQIYFNSVDQFALSGTSATDVSVTAPVSAAGSIANINLSLANEGNLAVVSQVIDKVMKQGVTLPLAYPTCIRQSLSKSTSHSYQIQLTKAYGNRILFIASAPFTPSRGGTYLDDVIIPKNNYHPRGVLTLYNSFLNGIAISYPPGYDCTKGQDYSLANKEFIRRSVIQTSGEYIYANWCHIDSFVGTKPLCDVDQSMIDGLDVGSQNSVFQLQATLYNADNGFSGGVSATWVNVIAGQKTMTLSANGVMVQ